MKAYIKNYGCQMNEQDALHMRGLLARMGYAATEEPLAADLILLVTCSIREKAVHKVYSDLGRIRFFKENNPDLIVGFAGCVAQQEKSAMFKRFPFIDMVFGPDAIKDLPDMVVKTQESRKNDTPTRLLHTRFHSKKDFEFVNLVTDSGENRVKAFVNVQKGCDNVCAFCVVPRTRGGEVSRPSREIVEEIKSLVDLGVKEVTLLGQNVNSYGFKDSDELTFAELLQQIGDETGIKRLRFTSSHPKDVGDDLVEKFRSLQILCPHFHLPVQSGSDRILSAMRRHYTRRDYLEKIVNLQKARSDIAFTTDLIVGFPGETEEDFQETLSLIEEVGFDLSFSFMYSPRPATLAEKMPDTVSKQEKSRRLEILQEFQRKVSGEKNRKLENTTTEVLVEDWDHQTKKGMGRNQHNKIVHFTMPNVDASKDLTGEIVQVHVTTGQRHSLIGEVV